MTTQPQASVPTLTPITACRLLGEEAARALPPYLHFVTEPKLFAGRALVLSVFAGTQALDEMLREVCNDRVVVVDAQCQTHTAFIGPSQLKLAMAGKARALLVLGAICNPAKLKKDAGIPIVAMGTTPRMAPSDDGVLRRYRCFTDIGAILDEGPKHTAPGDSIVGSEAGLVVAKTALVRTVFGDHAV